MFCAKEVPIVVFCHKHAPYNQCCVNMCDLYDAVYVSL